MPETAKDLIKQPKISKDEVLPKIHFSMLIIGSSGSGKSVLAYNIISKWYNGFYDMVLLISPTGIFFDKLLTFCLGKTDDIQKALDLPKNRVITDMEKAEAAVQMVENVQEEDIKKNGFENAKKILLYFDDVVGVLSSFCFALICFRTLFL